MLRTVADEWARRRADQSLAGGRCVDQLHPRRLCGASKRCDVLGYLTSAKRVRRYSRSLDEAEQMGTALLTASLPKPVDLPRDSQPTAAPQAFGLSCPSVTQMWRWDG